MNFYRRFFFESNFCKEGDNYEKLLKNLDEYFIRNISFIAQI